MSVRNGIALLLALSTLLFLAACGNNGNGVNNPVAPPSGAFSNSNLNGTYVFSLSGTDKGGDPYAMAGTFTANGSGGITGGSVDINDVVFLADSATPVADAPISNASYSITVDGRGQVKFATTNPIFNAITLDFVLSTDSHGLVIELDGIATGSGTIDLQAAGTTPSGSYAFSLGGSSFTGAPYATVGNFALTGTAAAGLEDFNEGGILVTPQETLSGSVVVSSTTPSTNLTFPNINTGLPLLFDVIPIDATHLKFIEMDQFATLSGDAFSQTTPTIAASTMAFTMTGEISSTPTAIGGFMVTDGAGNITNASSEDFNEGGSLSSAPGSFTASYTAAGTGRYTLGNFNGFVPTSPTYAAYPSSGGLLLLEIDTAGFTSGAAYTQTPGATLAASQGFGLNLSGENSTSGEVDDIAQFATGTSGSVSGLIDENTSGSTPVFDLVLSGSYTAPSGGRGALSAAAGNNTVSTANGGFNLIYYTVDGTNFPFIESDTTQVSAGVFVQQNATASSAAIAHPSMFVVRPVIRKHSTLKKSN
jgi:hypothetical protein